MIKYPSIEQFRHVVKEYCYIANKKDVKKGIVSFKGTVKLHGTNAGVGYNAITDELWAQSRNNVITPTKDNAGFAQFVQTHESDLKKICKNLLYYHPRFTADDNEDRDTGINTDTDTDIKGDIICLYGEWCGNGIQKGVALSELPKMYVVFDAIVMDTERSHYKWIHTDSFNVIRDLADIYPITLFPTWNIDIDFNHPQLSQNKMIEITNAVEQECPVAKHFGVSGVGEGVVWSTHVFNRVLRFKVKGDKHSVSKVTKLASVDVEKLSSIKDFVNYSVTEARINQAISEVAGSREPSKKDIGALIKWITCDIIKEESDTLKSNGLELKDIKSAISKKSLNMLKL